MSKSTVTSRVTSSVAIEKSDELFRLLNEDWTRRLTWGVENFFFKESFRESWGVKKLRESFSVLMLKVLPEVRRRARSLVNLGISAFLVCKLYFFVSAFQKLLVLIYTIVSRWPETTLLTSSDGEIREATACAPVAACDQVKLLLLRLGSLMSLIALSTAGDFSFPTKADWVNLIWKNRCFLDGKLWEGIWVRNFRSVCTAVLCNFSCSFS